MLKQISMAEAITRLQNGEEVKCIQVGDNWEDGRPVLLSRILENIIPMTDAVPASKNTPPKPPSIDLGKLGALKEAGWSVRNMSIEFGVSEPTIRKYLRELDGEAENGQKETA